MSKLIENVALCDLRNSLKPKKHVIYFPKERQYDLKSALSRLPSPHHHFDEFQTKAFRAVLSMIPEEIVRELISFKNTPTSPGYLIIRGLPFDQDLPDTPPDGGRSKNKTTFISEGINVGVGTLLGEVFGYDSEKNGELIHNICPTQESAHVLSNESSEVDFKFHVDNSFFEFRPHVLGLFCLRPDRTAAAATTLVEIKTALKELTPFEVNLLRLPLFRLRTPRSFQKNFEVGAWTMPVPVIFGPAQSPEVRLSYNGVEAITESARLVLEKLEKILQNDSVSLKWHSQPGDLILINNRKALHGRTYFKARYDGQDRWLQRVYVHTDPWMSRHSQHEGVVFGWSKP